MCLSVLCSGFINCQIPKNHYDQYLPELFSSKEMSNFARKENSGNFCQSDVYCTVMLTPELSPKTALTIIIQYVILFVILYVLKYCVFQYSDFLHPLGYDDSRKNSEPFLLVADSYGETIIQVDTTSGSKVTLPLVGVGRPHALDYDPVTDYVYWSDGGNKEIKRARRDGSGMETIIDTGRHGKL